MSTNAHWRWIRPSRRVRGFVSVYDPAGAALWAGPGARLGKGAENPLDASTRVWWVNQGKACD